MTQFKFTEKSEFNQFELFDKKPNKSVLCPSPPVIIPTTICFVNNNVAWYYSSILKDQDKEDGLNQKKDLDICKGFIKKRKKNERENEIKDEIFKALWRQCKELA